MQKLREGSFLPSNATPFRPRPVFLPVAIMFTWKVEDGSECVIKVELRKRKFYHCKRRKGKRYFEKCLKRLRASMARASSINLFTNVRSKLRYVARPRLDYIPRPDCYQMRRKNIFIVETFVTRRGAGSERKIDKQAETHCCANGILGCAIYVPLLQLPVALLWNRICSSRSALVSAEIPSSLFPLFNWREPVS